MLFFGASGGGCVQKDTVALLLLAPVPLRKEVKVGLRLDSNFSLRRDEEDLMKYLEDVIVNEKSPSTALLRYTLNKTVKEQEFLILLI